jgi:predicted kinase
VFFDIPLETCLERNEQRTGRAYVPRSVIRRMYASFEKDTQYGLDKVYIREENENDISNIRFTF